MDTMDRLDPKDLEALGNLAEKMGYQYTEDLTTAILEQVADASRRPDTATVADAVDGLLKTMGGPSGPVEDPLSRGGPAPG